MKLPRWLVIAMLTTSVLAPLAAAGWWWVTWPERTARQFIRSITERDYEGASKLMRFDSTQGKFQFWDFSYLDSSKNVSLKSGERSPVDVLLGRRHFTLLRNGLSVSAEPPLRTGGVGGGSGTIKSRFNHQFTIERGKLVVHTSTVYWFGTTVAVQLW